MTSMSDSEYFDLDLEEDIDLEEGKRTSSSGSSSSTSSRTGRIRNVSGERRNVSGESQSTSFGSNCCQVDKDRLELFFFQKVLTNLSDTVPDDEDSDRLFQEAAVVVFSALEKTFSKDPQPGSHDHELEVASRTYDISAKSLTYKVNVRTGNVVAQKVLLNNITAEARHGEVFAIMGPSGASKTTFLDALAGRISRKSMSGSVMVNGQPMTDRFKRASGYVMQDDVHFPLLTARETLMYSARLRLPNTMTNNEKKRRVDEILDLLGLKACADTQIGSEVIGGVSGGERRRISIAQDLIHEPMVLFLDEPTSGLDSTSALQVMQSLQKLAKEKSRTIILTIHQPSYRILDTIDNALMLAKGRIIYQGHPNDMIKFFSKLGFVKPDHVTVVEYMIDKIDECKDDLEKLRPHVQEPVTVTSKTERRSQRALSSYDYKMDLDEAAATDPKQLMSMAEFEDQPGDNLVQAESQVKFANSMLQEIWVLSQRNLKNNIRNRTLFLSRTLIVLLTSLIMATLFFNSRRDRDGIRQRQVFFSFTIAILVFTSFEAMPIFLMEREIFIRETSRGAYRASSYAISYSVTFLPFMLLLAILCTFTSYFAVGLVIKANAIFFFALVLFLVLSISNAFVAFISGLAPNFIAGLVIFGATSAYQFLFSGFFMPRHTIPKYWLFLHYGSFFKYSYEALIVNEFKNIPGHLWFRDITSERILAAFDFKRDTTHQWLNVLYLICFFVGYRFLFYLTLVVKTNNIRR